MRNSLKDVKPLKRYEHANKSVKTKIGVLMAGYKQPLNVFLSTF